MGDDQMDQWTRFCTGCAQVWLKTYQYFVEHGQPGTASWFHIGHQVWVALGESAELMGKFYQPIYEKTIHGQVSAVAEAAQYIADNLEVRDHWYVEVLRRTAGIWMANFGPKTNKAVVHKVVVDKVATETGTRLLDSVERAIAEAMVAVRNYHTGTCQCIRCGRWQEKFDEWASHLGD